MTLKEMVGLLQEDIARERAHMMFYLHASTAVIGLHREELSEYFTNEAQSEMKHVQEFAKLIIGLGSWASANIAQHRTDICDPALLLAEALRMEEEVVKNYVQRMDQAHALATDGWQVEGRYIEIFLENQILDSRGNADELKQMLT